MKRGGSNSGSELGVLNMKFSISQLERIPKSSTRFSEQMRDKTKCQTALTDSHFAKRGLA